MKMFTCLFLLAVLGATPAFADRQLIHDGHIHYDEDVWDMLPPAQAVAMLRRENIQRALVSGTPTEGAEMLYREDPELVIPMLRPYGSWRHRYFWFKDPELKAYLEDHLSRVPYRGFGEFHVFGKHMDTSQIEDMIAIARERKLVMHPHTDAEGMRILLEKTEGIPVLWAHGGFDEPVSLLREFMQRYDHFYVELSLRDEMLEADGSLRQEWRDFFLDYPQRFLVGMDTYKPSRWADLPETAAATRSWLRQLPDDVSEQVAYRNLDRLFPPD